MSQTLQLSRFLVILLLIGLVFGVVITGTAAGEASGTDREVPRGSVVEIDAPSFPHTTYDFRVEVTGENYSLTADVGTITDSEYTLSFNTYFAGSGDSNVIGGSGIADVEIQETSSFDGQLPEGNYTISLMAGDKQFSQEEFTLTQSALVPDVELYRAASLPETVTDETLSAKFSQGDLIQTNQLVDPAQHDELIVLRVEAPALEGMLAGTGKANISTQLDALAATRAIDHRLVTGNESTEIPIEQATIIHDSSTLYFAWDSSTLFESTDALQTNSSITGQMEFTITDMHHLGFTSDTEPFARGLSAQLLRSGTTSSTFMPEHSTVSAPTDDDDAIPLTSNLTIDLETNLAPGTSGELVLRSEDAKRSYFFRDRIIVDNQQRAVGTFNLTHGATVGDTVRINADPFEIEEQELHIVGS